MKTNNPANPKNKFDYVGDIHNQIVSVYVQKYGRKERPVNEICMLTQEIASENEDIQKLPDADANIKVDCDFIEKGLEDFTNQYKNIINSLDITEKAKKKLEELVDYMFELSFSPYDTPYQDFYSHVVEYEASIIGNDQYTKEDIEILLSTSSTVRYAGYYWKSELNETSLTSSSQRRKWWQWTIIGVSDGVGIAGGGISGGAAASNLAFTMTNPNTK